MDVEAEDELEISTLGEEEIEYAQDSFLSLMEKQVDETCTDECSFHSLYDPYAGEIPPLSSQKHLTSAISFLQIPSPHEGVSLFDHLRELLNKIITERPENVIDYFEEFSRKVKEARFRAATDHLQDLFVDDDVPLARKRLELFKVVPLDKEDEGEEVAEDEEANLELNRPNIMELLYYFEQAGIALPRMEMFCIALSIQKFVKEKPIQKVRFWGKMFGTEKNYFVLETEQTETEIERRTIEAEEIERLRLEAEEQERIRKEEEIAEREKAEAEAAELAKQLEEEELKRKEEERLKDEEDRQKEEAERLKEEERLKESDPGAVTEEGAIPKVGAEPTDGAQPIEGAEPIEGAQSIEGAGPIEGAQPIDGADAIQEAGVGIETAVGEQGTAILIFQKPPPKLPPIPESHYKPPPVVPVEKIGEGLNKKIYYVCNDPTEEWIILPDVTPQQISSARKIKRFFTGDLDTEINTFPAFPGTERNYLRAQLARISAGSQVSPLGFFKFEGDEGEDEADDEEEGIGEVKTNLEENHDYEPVSLKDLTDGSFSFWVHHSLHILNQGRTIWWNPNATGGDEEEEADVEEEEDEGKDVVPRETGPPLLTALSEDASLETVPPWSVRLSSQFLPNQTMTVIRSNLWPGAFAFAFEKKVENIYIGWGHKYVSNNYSPMPMEAIQKEYLQGPEIMEINDPTVEEEEAWRLAHEKKPPPPPGEEEEEEDEGDEEDEDEDEDD